MTPAERRMSALAELQGAADAYHCALYALDDASGPMLTPLSSIADVAWEDLHAAVALARQARVPESAITDLLREAGAETLMAESL